MRLFCDCKTDEEKSNFFLSGRAVETGIIASAISNDVAMAYHRCAEFRKEIDALQAKLEEAEQQEPVRDWWDCLIADISAIDCMYRGSPTYAHDAYWMREHVVRMLEQRRDASPGAQAMLRVPDAVMAALENLDDYIARIEGNDRGACNHINLVRRYLLDAAGVGGTNEYRDA